MLEKASSIFEKIVTNSSYFYTNLMVIMTLVEFILCQDALIKLVIPDKEILTALNPYLFEALLGRVLLMYSSAALMNNSHALTPNRRAIIKALTCVGGCTLSFLCFCLQVNQFFLTSSYKACADSELNGDLFSTQESKLSRFYRHEA